MTKALIGTLVGRFYVVFYGGPFFVADSDDEVRELLSSLGLRRKTLPCEADVPDSVLQLAEQQRTDAKAASGLPQTIRFSCSSCDKRFQCGSKNSGRQAVCPECGTKTRVPFVCGEKAACTKLRHPNCSGLATAADGLCDLCYGTQSEILTEVTGQLLQWCAQQHNMRWMKRSALQLRSELTLGQGLSEDATYEPLLITQILVGLGLSQLPQDFQDRAKDARKLFKARVAHDPPNVG